jgi:phenylalanyl-tRNA synthetase beta chain
MRFSLSFVKEFFVPQKSPQELASLLTMAGMEVEHLQNLDDDWIFDIEVTSNRYDWLSIVGIAREIACVCGRRIKVVYPPILKRPPLKEIDIIIEDLSDCPFYVARLITGLKVSDSPKWLKKRLVSCGLNSINNIVDITNYCMLRWGNPLHAFDFDKIEGDIFVRRAKEKERFMGLDGKERILNQDNLVIADSRKVIALAGVMGAKNTEVDKNTKNVLLEAAIFSPLAIRRSRRSVGLQTESSYRFERNVFPDYVEVASSQASNLILSLSGGRFCGYKRSGKKPVVKRKRILLRISNVSGYIGEIISSQKIKGIFKNLEFRVIKATKDKVRVEVPLHRLDIQREVDVYEEIARIYGYQKIKPTLPYIQKVRVPDLYTFKKSLRNFLISLGLKEVITYSITSQDTLERLKERSYIKIVNPLRKQENVLRTTLLSGAIEVVRYNLNQKATNLKLFEIANVYMREENGFKERPRLAVMLTGQKETALHLKGIVEEVFAFLNINNIEFKGKERVNFTNALEIIKNNQLFGFLGKLDRGVRDEFDLKEDLYFAELDLQVLFREKKEISFRSFSKYPCVYRDISLGLNKEKNFEIVGNLIKRGASPFFKELRVLDVYEKGLPPNFYGLTLRVYYQSSERTLTSQEVDSLHNKIREELAKLEGVFLR